MPEPVNSYWDLIDPIWDSVDIDTTTSFLASAATIPQPLLHLYASHFCQSEVCNGGFLQFFWNSTGVLAPEAIAGFNVIGLTELASIITEASLRLGVPYPRDRRERWNALLKLSGRSEQELETIFKTATSEFGAFREALKPVSFQAQEEIFYRLVYVERGGFNEAATLYAQSLTSKA